MKDLEAQMKKAAKALDFEKAALIRDRIFDLRKNLDPIDINPEEEIWQTLNSRIVPKPGRNAASGNCAKRGTHRRIRQRAGENIP